MNTNAGTLTFYQTNNKYIFGHTWLGTDHHYVGNCFLEMSTMMITPPNFAMKTPWVDIPSKYLYKEDYTSPTGDFRLKWTKISKPELCFFVPELS